MSPHKIVQPTTEAEVHANQSGALMVPSCDCISAVNEVLAPANGRLGSKGAGRSAVPIVFVRRINPTGEMPPTLVPVFCPFCGEPFGGAKRKPKHMVGIANASDVPMTVMQAVRVLLCTSQFSTADADRTLAAATTSISDQTAETAENLP